jgi:hypothetical protein
MVAAASKVITIAMCPASSVRDVEWIEAPVCSGAALPPSASASGHGYLATKIQIAYRPRYANFRDTLDPELMPLWKRLASLSPKLTGTIQPN